jgi:hypothetical protein
MNLVLFGYVAWKHRWLLLVGLVVALLLAFFSVFRVGSGGISYRQPEQWATHEILLVTQPGFPVGRTTLNIPGAPAPAANPSSPQFVDPARLTDLATLYAQLATSDVIRRRMLTRGRIDGAKELEAQAVSDANGNALPLIDIAASADSAAGSERLAERASWALQSYIVEGQQASKVSAGERVVLKVLSSAPGTSTDAFGKSTSDPELVKGPSKFRPVMVFVVVFLLFIGIAFVVENTGGRQGIRSFLARQRVLAESPGGAGPGEPDPQPEFPVDELAAGAGGSFAVGSGVAGNDPARRPGAPVGEAAPGASAGRAEQSSRQRQAARRPRNSRGQFTRLRDPNDVRRTDQQWATNGGPARAETTAAEPPKPNPDPAETAAVQPVPGPAGRPDYPVGHLAVAAGGWRKAAERSSAEPEEGSASAEDLRPADQQARLP